MAKQQQEVYFVFMNFDPAYERLRADRYGNYKLALLHSLLQFQFSLMMILIAVSRMIDE